MTFPIAIVLEGVRDEHTRAAAKADNEHDKRLREWQSLKSRRAQAEKLIAERVNALVERLDNHADLPEAALFKGIADVLYPLIDPSGSRRSGAFEDAVKLLADDLPTIPQRVRSARERSLEHVVKLLEAYDQPTISIQGLRSLGVLEYVKHSKEAC